MEYSDIGCFLFVFFLNAGVILQGGESHVCLFNASVQEGSQVSRLIP